MLYGIYRKYCHWFSYEWVSWNWYTSQHMTLGDFLCFIMLTKTCILFQDNKIHSNICKPSQSSPINWAKQHLGLRSTDWAHSGAHVIYCTATDVHPQALTTRSWTRLPVRCWSHSPPLTNAWPTSCARSPGQLVTWLRRRERQSSWPGENPGTAIRSTVHISSESEPAFACLMISFGVGSFSFDGYAVILYHRIRIAI